MEELEIVSYDWDTVMHKANLVIPVDDVRIDVDPYLVADPEAYFSSLNWLLTQQKPNLGTRGT